MYRFHVEFICNIHIGICLKDIYLGHHHHRRCRRRRRRRHHQWLVLMISHYMTIGRQHPFAISTEITNELCFTTRTPLLC